ncbi:hypothetical protein, partial [Atlantibacter hermannii]|uniref:hypothetical protein n=1 Tax=Atlantibacter hermannii TaxID=565 RepID=UPI0028AFC8DB
MVDILDTRYVTGALARQDFCPGWGGRCIPAGAAPGKGLGAFLLTSCMVDILDTRYVTGALA